MGQIGISTTGGEVDKNGRNGILRRYCGNPGKKAMRKSKRKPMV